MSRIRSRLYRQLDPLAWQERGLSPVNRIVLAVVMFSVLSAILESEPEIVAAFPRAFRGLDTAFAVLFAVEYGVRLWAMAENPRYAGIGGMFRYARTFASLVDLVATSALWLDVLFGIPGVYGVLLRLVRVLRALTLTRNSQWATAIRLLRDALAERMMELTLSLAFAGIILVICATGLYAAEGTVQPENFGSIPRAMWWAVVTLTTVGYGDAYPVTAIGKVLAGLVALTSIAIVAMPTGIMAAAFSGAFHRLREEKGSAVRQT